VLAVYQLVGLVTYAHIIIHCRKVYFSSSTFTPNQIKIPLYVHYILHTVNTKAQYHAYIINGSKISVSNFPKVAEQLFRVVVREELRYVGISEASRSTSHWTRHCRMSTCMHSR